MGLNSHDHRYLAASFAGVNLLLAAMSVVSLIGLRHSVTDVMFAIRRFVYVPTGAPSQTVISPTDDWASVLFDGRDEKPRPARAGVFDDPEDLFDESVNA